MGQFPWVFFKVDTVKSDPTVSAFDVAGRAR